jgi:DNA polymerase-3 subunit gamma/tau
MIARMREIADAEGIPIDDGALGAIAYRADGGLRDALTMLEQVSSFAGDGAVDADTVEAAFGQTGRAFARALRDVTLDGDAAAALRIIDEASDAGTDMSGLIRSTLAEFRHLLVARVNAELLARDLAEDDARAARERAAATPQARLVRALRLLADALASARNSGNARLELESAVLRFVLQGEDPTLDALASRLAALESGEASAPRAAAAPAAAVAPTPHREAPPPRQDTPPPSRQEAPRVAHEAPTPEPSRIEPTRAEPVRAEPAAVAAEPDAVAPASPPKELSLTKIRSLWQSIRMRAEGEKGSLRAGLSRATVASLDGDVLTLRVPDPPASEVLRRDAATVKKAIADVIGRNLELRIALGAGAPPAETGSGAPPSGIANGGGEDSDDLMRYALEKLS